MKPVALAVGTALLAASLAACARSAEERQLDSMRSDIDQIQSDRDRADEVAPAGGSPASAARAPVRASAPPPPPPSFDAVQVGVANEAPTDTETDYQDPQDTSPRPVIRVVGSSRLGARGGLGDGVVEDTSDDESGSSLDPAAKRAYDAAIAQVNAKQYPVALSALAEFLVKWPDHPYADHAMYWRGECYFAQRDYAHAAEQFEGVIARFPSGMKAPDALYKLGQSYRKLGQEAQARASFDRLLQDYPQSDAARLVSSSSVGVGSAGASPADDATGAANPKPSAAPAPASQGHP